MDDGSHYDLVVLGSGAAGLTAAFAARLAGLRCLVLEHAETVGGTSARSSGTVWVPASHHLEARGVHGDRAAAEAYLASLVGDRGEEAMWRAFLDAAPRMLRDLETRAGFAFRPFMAAPDYRQDHPGAASGGRALEPPPFDGRLLGDDFARLEPPLPELMLFGGMMLTRAEAAELLRAGRAPRAAWLGLRLVARYLMDRLRHRRGTRLVLGNALVARLFSRCRDAGVEVLTAATPHSLVVEDGRVTGVRFAHDGIERTAHARRGVVMAGGGYPASRQWREEQLPKPTPDHSPAAPGCDGSTIALALAAGGTLGPSGLDNAFWFPGSVMTRPDGSTAVWPHIVLDRPKPGLIAVDRTGRRFVNEAVSYHEFVRAMYASGAVPAWLVCDRAFIRRYGLGLIRPRSPSLRRYVRNGYLKEADSISGLAARIGVPADALAATVERWNNAAATGKDTEFGKGESIYDRAGGDPDVRPNPCVGPVAAPPFYAVEIVPTPLGTSRGLRADVNARVLDRDGKPVPGLYVCGNDMQSAFGGEYPGAGAQLGQGMTFGWIAANHAAGERN